MPRLLIKFPSHRSREYVLKFLGDPDRKILTSFERDTGKGVIEVTPTEIERLEKQSKPGTFKKFKDGPDVRRSWKMEGYSNRSDKMRTLLEKLEAMTKTGVMLRVLPGGVGVSNSQARPMHVSGQLSSAGELPKNRIRVSGDIEAGVPIAKTVETNGMRIHRYRPSLRVTDLTNAGKRGKRVDSFTVYDIDMIFQDDLQKVEGYLKAIANARSYAQAEKLGKDFADEVREVGFDKTPYRGIDVDPPAGSVGAVIEIETPTFSLKSSKKDFSVFEKRRPGLTGDDTTNIIPPSYGAKKTAIANFYRWVQANQGEIKRMTFRELNRAMADADLAYHAYSTMD